VITPLGRFGSVHQAAWHYGLTAAGTTGLCQGRMAALHMVWQCLVGRVFSVNATRLSSVTKKGDRRMDRTMVKQHLAQADEHVLISERHIVSQRALVADLEQKGHDTTQARRLLATFEKIQAMRHADCDRLRRELVALSK
jgi:hypothetical protein